jgi:hypothetical protein
MRENQAEHSAMLRGCSPMARSARVVPHVFCGSLVDKPSSSHLRLEQEPGWIRFLLQTCIMGAPDLSKVKLNELFSNPITATS